MKTSLLIAGSLALVPMTYAQDKPNIIIILADDLGFSDPVMRTVWRIDNDQFQLIQSNELFKTAHNTG